MARGLGVPQPWVIPDRDCSPDPLCTMAQLFFSFLEEMFPYFL